MLMLTVILMMLGNIVLILMLKMTIFMDIKSRECHWLTTDRQHSLPKSDMRDVLSSSIHLCCSSSLDSSDPPPSCAPEVVLKSLPVWEEKEGSPSTGLWLSFSKT